MAFSAFNRNPAPKADSRNAAQSASKPAASESVQAGAVQSAARVGAGSKATAAGIRIAAIVLCAVAVATTVFSWQGGSLFDADFSWAETDYSAKKAYESEAFQVKEDDLTDRQLSESDKDLNDDGEQDAASSSGRSSLFQAALNGQEVISGGDGSAQGGGQSGGKVPGSSGNEPGGDPGREPEYVPNPDQIRTPEKDPTFQQGNRNSMVSLDLSGMAHVKKGKVTRDDLLAFVSKRATVAVNGDPNNIIDYSSQLKGSSFHFGEGIDENGAVSKTLSFTYMNEIGHHPTTIYYGENYLSFHQTIDVYVHENVVTFEDLDTGGTLSPPGSLNSKYFFDCSYFEIPEDVWAFCIDRANVSYNPDGSMASIFPGFISAGSYVGSFIEKDSASIALMVPASPVPCERYVIYRNGSDQVFTGIRDAGAVVDGILDIPDGVTKVALGSTIDATVTSITIPSSVKEIDIASVMHAYPNLESWKVNGNFVYKDDGGMLKKKVDLSADGSADADADWAIVSIPSALVVDDTLVVPEGVRSFDADAFAGFTQAQLQSLKLRFESEKPQIENWYSIPQSVKVIAPGTFTDPMTGAVVQSDIPYCRYLSALSMNRLASKLAPIDAAASRPSGEYFADGAGFVYFVSDYDVDAHELTLCYVPSDGSVSLEISEDVRTIASGACIDASGIAAVIIPASVQAIEANAFAGAKSAESIVVEASGVIDLPQVGSVFGVFGGGTDASAFINSNLTVYLNSTAPDSASDPNYALWLAQLARTFGASDAEAHIKHISANANGQVFIDSRTGAIYLSKQDGANETVQLVKVPSDASSLEILDSATSIAANSIVGCNNIKLIAVPDSVREIASDAIGDCESLEVLYVPNLGGFDSGNVPDYGASVGNGCPNMKAVALKDRIARVGQFEFYDNAQGELVALVSDFEGVLNVPGNITSIADRAARNCQGLKGASLPTLKRIGAEAFANCAIEGNLALRGDGLVLGADCFGNCTSINSVEVSGTIGSLGTSAFKGCSGIVEVSLGSAQGSIGSLGQTAFANCTRLASVSFGGSVGAIGYGSFAGCSALTKVAFDAAASSSIARIEDYAFAACARLTGFPFASLSSLESIGRYAFAGDSKLLSMSIPDSLIEVKESAFASITTGTAFPADLSLALSTDLDSGLLSVNAAADSKLSSIKDSAFYGCASLASLNLSNVAAGLLIGDSAFKSCTSMSSVDLSSSVTEIGAHAFEDCSAMQLIRGDLSGVSSIGVAAFKGCTALTHLSLAASSILSLPQSAFEDCTTLKNVDLPSSLSELGANSFKDCTSFARVTLQSEHKVATAADVFSPEMPKRVVVVVSADRLEEYRADPMWRAAMTADDGIVYDQNIISAGSGTNTIMSATYRTEVNSSGESETHLLTVDPSAASAGFEIQYGTTHIDSEAFKDCVTVKTLIVPESVHFIGRDALLGCTSLENLIFEGDACPQIDGDLFGGSQPNGNYRVYCKAGTKGGFENIAALQSGVPIECGNSFSRDMVSGAFYSNYESSGIHMLVRIPKSYSGEITLDASTNWIAEYAAKDCTGLTSINIRRNVKKIAPFAFMGCTNLRSVPLDNTTGQRLYEIAESAFEGCTSLATTGGSSSYPVRTPASMQVLGKRAFAGCSAIVGVSIQGVMSELPEQLFAGCTALKVVTGSTSYISNLSTIGKECFAGCTAFTTFAASLSAFTGLKTIREGAYKDCSNLALITFPASLAAIEKDAFAGASKVGAIAFNGASPVSVARSGLDACWPGARVFVPSGTKAAYSARWSADGFSSPLLVDAISASYRAVSGNLYAEGDGGRLTFVAATSAAIATGTVDGIRMPRLAAYNGSGLSTVAINEDALNGMAGFAGFDAGKNLEIVGARAFMGSSIQRIDFKASGSEVSTKSLRINAQAFEDCASLASVKLRATTNFIGSRAFANVASGFTLDISLKDSMPTTQEKIFGESLPAGARILLFENDSATDAFNALAREWGRIMVRDYGLSAEGIVSFIPGLSADLAAEIVAEANPAETMTGDGPDVINTITGDGPDAINTMTDDDPDAGKDDTGSSDNAEGAGDVAASDTSQSDADASDAPDAPNISGTSEDPSAIDSAAGERQYEAESV